MYVEHKTGVTFDDVAGIDEVRRVWPAWRDALVIVAPATGEDAPPASPIPRRASSRDGGVGVVSLELSVFWP